MSTDEVQTSSSSDALATIAGGDTICPVCSRDAQDAMVPLSELDYELAQLIRANAPDAKGLQSACKRCVGLFERAHKQVITLSLIHI